MTRLDSLMGEAEGLEASPHGVWCGVEDVLGRAPLCGPYPWPYSLNEVAHVAGEVGPEKLLLVGDSPGEVFSSALCGSGSSLGGLAVRYAACTLRVHPLRELEKLPATANGFHDATCDLAKVKQFWRDMPQANIGVATGKSGLVVVDLDGEQALRCWQELLRAHPGACPTLTVKTLRGWHLYYSAPVGVEVRNSAGKLGPGIDVRGSGGYVVAPGSRRPGFTYSWHNPGVPIADLPTWLVEKLAPTHRNIRRDVGLPRQFDHTRPYVRAAITQELDRLRTAGEGTRNHTLFQVAAALGRFVVGGEVDHQKLVDSLELVALEVGLPVGESQATIRSGIRAASR